MRWLAVVYALSACGRIAFEDRASEGPQPDSSTDSTTFGPWSPPTPFPQINAPGAIDWAPALSPDGQTLVFSSDRPPASSANEDLFVSMFSGGTWTTPAAIVSINSSTHETDPAWTPDGKTLYFSSTRGSMYRVYTSAFDGTTFAPPVLASGFETTDALISAVASDGLEMIYTLPSPVDLAHATRASQGAPWTPAGPLTPLNTPVDDGYASLSFDRLTIYFETVRDGSRDLYFATRPTPTAPFGAPQPLTDLNTPFAESDPDISADGHILLFSSDRTNESTIYISTR